MENATLTLSPVAMSGSSNRTVIRDLILSIKDIFQANFDKAWFGVLMDDVPMGTHTIRQIRSLVGFDTVIAGDERDIYLGVLELEEFIRNIRQYLLPLIREKLGISKLCPSSLVQDRNQYLLRKLIAYTFPYNLERLTSLTEQLRDVLLSAYPYLGNQAG